jgi:hypothetical protein
MARDPIDELYGLELEDFVRERDALAKRLRDEGDKEGAAAVKKLAKPTRAAWAVNRLVRDRPKEMRALVEAGEALSGAQEQLLEGADAAVLRQAADAARNLVDALAAEAPVDGPTRDKVRSTLHAATVDEDVRAEIASGRLLKERAASGFGGLDALARAGAGGGGGTRKRAAPKAKAARAKPRDDRAAKARAKTLARRRDDLRRAKEAEATAEDAVAGARHALAQVEATVTARRRDLDQAEKALSDARRRRERAEQAAQEASAQA